ncbi:hypothetical protein TNCV_1602521 [Trichonephila clavipes]|nr:hypothetical protein TNCV_1602521 [Trichonephila clavipes]
MTSITKNDNSGLHKIFNRKKILNRFYFPPTLPHSTHIRLWCRAGISNLGPLSKRTTTPAVTKYSKEKDVKSIIFPNQTFRILPTFICGAGPENQHMTSITKNDNSSPHKIFNRKKMLNRFISHLPSRIPPTFVCGAGPDIQLRTSIKKNDNSGRHKIFKRKKRC